MQAMRGQYLGVIDSIERTLLTVAHQSHNYCDYYLHAEPELTIKNLSAFQDNYCWVFTGARMFFLSLNEHCHITANQQRGIVPPAGGRTACVANNRLTASETQMHI